MSATVTLVCCDCDGLMHLHNGRYFCTPCGNATCDRCTIIQPKVRLVGGVCGLCARELAGFRLERKMDIEQMCRLFDVGHGPALKSASTTRRPTHAEFVEA